MSFQIKRDTHDDADLDVTSFMNLMVVLVPVLLLSLTFTQVRALNISLADLTGDAANSSDAQSQLEVVVKKKAIHVYYPAGVLVKSIPALNKGGVDELDFSTLSQVMREVKKQLKDKKAVLISSGADIDYQNLVSAMDSVKSYRTVVATDLVEVELFPEISLGDAG